MGWVTAKNGKKFWIAETDKERQLTREERIKIKPPKDNIANGRPYDKQPTYSKKFLKNWRKDN